MFVSMASAGAHFCVFYVCLYGQCRGTLLCVLCLSLWPVQGHTFVRFMFTSKCTKLQMITGCFKKKLTTRCPLRVVLPSELMPSYVPDMCYN